MNGHTAYLPIIALAFLFILGIVSLSLGINGPVLVTVAGGISAIGGWIAKGLKRGRR